MADQYWEVSGSRILDANRVDISGADNTYGHTCYEDPFILAVCVYTSKGPLARNISLYWRNLTDGGTFAPLGATGQLAYSTDTVLSNDNAVTSTEKRCTAVGGYTWQDGVECTDGSISHTLNDEYYSEHQFAITAAGATAHEGDTFEFELYDDSLGSPFPSTLGAQYYLSPLFTGDITAEVGGGDTPVGTLPPVYYRATPSQLASFGCSTDADIAQIVPEGFNDYDRNKYAHVFYETYPGDSVKNIHYSSYVPIRSKTPKSSGKWYAEFQAFPFTSTYTYVYQNCGICNANQLLSDGYRIGQTTDGWGILGYTNTSRTSYHGGATPTTLFTGDVGKTVIVQVAVDIDTGKVWFGENNSWYGDPAAGTGEALQDNDIIGADIYLACSVRASSYFAYMQKMFCKSGVNNYTPPSGFQLWGDEDLPITNTIEFDPADTYDADNPQVAGEYNNCNFPYADGTTYPGIRGIDEIAADRLYMEIGLYDPEPNRASYTAKGFSIIVGTTTSSLISINQYGKIRVAQSGSNTIIYYVVGALTVYQTITSHTLTTDDRLMLAVNFDTGKMWVGFNGTWYGDPVAETDPVYSGLTGTRSLVSQARLYATSQIWQATRMFQPHENNYDPPDGYPAGFGPRQPMTIEVSITGAMGSGHGDEGVYQGERWFRTLEGFAAFGHPTMSGILEYLCGPAAPVGYSDTDKYTGVLYAGSYNESIYTSTYGTTHRGARSDIGHTSGKYYIECGIYGSPNGLRFGIANMNCSLNNYPGQTYYTSYGIVYSQSGANCVLALVVGGSAFVTITLTGHTLSVDDRVQIAIELKGDSDGSMWIGVNDTWDGDPAAGTGAALANELTPGYGAYYLFGHCFYYTTTYQGTVYAAEAVQTYDPPSGFTGDWGPGGDQCIEVDTIVEKLGLAAGIVGDRQSEYEVSITGALGINDHIYQGEGTEHLGAITGRLGAGHSYTLPGSTYNTTIHGRLGGSMADASEWDWEPTLFRYLDGRPGQVGAAFGGYAKASLYGVDYYKYINFASRNYEVTFTGGQGLVVVPITSFVLHLRDGEPSSLSVTVQGHYADILSQATGMQLEVIWKFAGSELARESIITAPIDSFNSREEGTSTVCNIHGSSTKAYPGSKEVTLQGVQYQSVIEGKQRYRAKYDFNLEPGDQVSAMDNIFTAEEIILTVSITENKQVSEVMEVSGY